MKLLIDLDGPLLDVSLRYYRVYSDIVRELGFSPLPLETYWNLKRNRTPVKEILASTCPGEHPPGYVERRLLLIESPGYLAFDRLVPGALAVMEKLAQTEELHLVTLRRNRKTLVEEIGRLGLKRIFTSVISWEGIADEVPVKRDLIVESHVIREGEPALIVGDTEGDILAGKSMGISTCAVLNGIRNRLLIAEVKPDYTIEDIGGLPRVVEEIRSENR